jgi:hypothetical protein
LLKSNCCFLIATVIAVTSGIARAAGDFSRNPPGCANIQAAIPSAPFLDFI